jgi:lactate permease
MPTKQIFPCGLILAHYFLVEKESTMLIILAAFPILLVGFLMLVLSWSSSKAMPLGWGVAVIIAAFAWNMPFTWIAAATIAGIINAIDILVIVFGALLILQLLRRSGGLAGISQSMTEISSDRRIQVIIIAWFMGSFLEGAAGFGTPAAVGAPLLVGMGFPPLIAAIVTLMCDSVAVVYGAVGVPIWGGFETLRTLENWPVSVNGVLLQFRDFIINIGSFAGILNLLVGTFIPLLTIAVMVRICRSPLRTGLQIWPTALIAGLLYTIPQAIIASFIGPELPSLIGSLIGLTLFIILIKYKMLPAASTWDFPDHKAWPSEWEGIIKAGEHQMVSVDMPMSAFRAWVPYILIGILLLIGRIPELGLISVLKSLSVGWENILGTNISRSIVPFYNPGIFPFLLIALLIPFIHKLNWRSASRAWGEVTHMIFPAAVALVFALGLVYIMVNTGGATGGDSMLIVLAKAAALYTGAFWYIVAPFVGMLGAFVSGSATVSNIMFGPFQYGTAQTAGLPITPTLALQVIGSAAGNMICIHNVVAVLTTVGLAGKEGIVIRRNLPVCIFYGLLGGIVTWLIIVVFYDAIF